MKPVSFAAQNAVLGPPLGEILDACYDRHGIPVADPPVVVSLPIYTDGVACLSCWRPTLKERLSVLVFGRAWLWSLSGRTQAPVRVEAGRVP